jgi:hypothetical protein
MTTAAIDNGLVAKPPAAKRDVQWADVCYPALPPTICAFFPPFAKVHDNADSMGIGYPRPCVFLCRDRPWVPCVRMARAIHGSSALSISASHSSIGPGRGLHGSLHLLSVFRIRLFNQAVETRACWQSRRSEKSHR